MRLLQKLAVIGLLASTAAPLAMAQSNTRTTTVEYVVKPEDSASSILLSFGIGTANSPYRIYGDDGFLRKMRRANPNVDFNRLVAGSVLRVVIPVAGANDYPRMGGNTPPANPTTRYNTGAVSTQTAPRRSSIASVYDRGSTSTSPGVQPPRLPPPAVPPPPMAPPPVPPVPTSVAPHVPQPTTSDAQLGWPSHGAPSGWPDSAHERPVESTTQQFKNYDPAPRRQPRPSTPAIKRPAPRPNYEPRRSPEEQPITDETLENESIDVPSGAITTYPQETISPQPEYDAAPMEQTREPTTRSAGVFDCSIKLEQAVVNVQPGYSVGIKRELYRVRQDDDIASILYERGIGRPDNFAKLFGERGWIARNKLYSAGRVDLDNLQPGQKLTVIYPVQTKYDPCRSSQPALVATQPAVTPSADPQGKTAALNVQDENADFLPATEVVAPPQAPPLTETQAAETQAPATPGETQRAGTITDQTSDTGLTKTKPVNPVTAPRVIPPILRRLAQLTPAERAKLDPKALSKALDEPTLAILDERTLAALPDSVVADKAKEVSALEAKQPGMTRLFKRLRAQTPSAYIGTRAGLSLAARKNQLLSKVASLGLIVETRQGITKGLRLIVDAAPRVEVEDDGYEQYFEYNRILLGGALEFASPFLFDLLHITPRIGRYHIAAKSPAGQTFWGEKLSNELSIEKAVAGGVEVDAEWARFFYIVRLWASRDVVIPVIKNDYKSTTTRAGIDTYIKGSAFQLFGTRFSPNYLIFAAYEDILLSGAKESNSKQKLQVNLPTAGLGITFTAN